MTRLDIKKTFNALRYIIGPKYRKSYSQCAEDLIIAHIFKGLGILKPSYIDIGANDPVILSNTYLFYTRGSKGICIEPNPALVQKIKSKRPHDTVLEIGLSSETTTMLYYMFKNHVLNTFSKSEADAAKNQGYDIIHTAHIDMRTLAEVLVEQNVTDVDLLSLDVEGLDLEILKNINYTTFRPKVICVETKSFAPTETTNGKSPIVSFLEEKSYKVTSLTPINTIFVDTTLKIN